MTFIKGLIGHAKCCACDKPFKDGDKHHVIPVNFLADWEIPKTRDGKAVALICDKCLNIAAEIHYVIECGVIYHDVNPTGHNAN